MEITPYKNGIHSLAIGLKNLKEFLEAGNDPYLMKEVVIKIHHGLETLFKDLLFQKNPIFILDEKTTMRDILSYYQGFFDGKNNYLFDEAKTISPTETIQRLVSLKIIDGLKKKDLSQLISSFDVLNSVRNQLQHFAIKADPDSLVRVMGNLIPRSVSVLRTCYTSANNLPHQLRANIVPHGPLLGMEGLFNQFRNIDADLKSIYSEAIEVLGELESRYDILLNEAIQKFKSSTVKQLPLSVKIRDHGHCGAPPCMPEITLQGWLNESFAPHRNARENRFPFDREPILAIYEGTTKIDQPQILESASEWHGQTKCRTKIMVTAKMLVLSPAGFFDIPEYEEYVPFIKMPEVSFLLEIECESEGLFNDHHFDISRISSLNGKLTIDLSSMAFGDTEKMPSISATQEIELNSTNTSLRLHSFVESNKRLRDNYSLEIGVEEDEDLVFS
ncbi:hypothetical protein [Teredinibacter turnerae]|uniref:hypothetical protein n=1 Tax=Teredinibacter turnerae TaxID=2426 RepID=UPI00035E7624|nr:hypothetical protein [Teredinibacter turnerae]